MVQSGVVKYRSHIRFNGLCIFVAAYLSIFVFAAIILFTSLTHIKRNKDFLSQSASTSNKFISLTKLDDIITSYNTIDLFLNEERHSYSSVDDLLITTLFVKNNSNHFLSNKRLNSLLENAKINLYWPYHYSALINCTSIQEVRDLSYVAGGWTKSVYRGIFRGEEVAVKIVNYYGHDIQQCQIQNGSLNLCYERAETKILKEIILLHELSHPNVVKILGFCAPGTIGTVALVTELGEPLDLVLLLQSSWEDRLRLILGIAKLLEHLANSPVGPLAMNDFRRQQFVLVDGELKLSDVDDLGIGEPLCENDGTCQSLFHLFPFQENADEKGSFHNLVRCVNQRCIGHNARINIWHAGQHFVKLLLPINAPKDLKSLVENILTAYKLRLKSPEDGDTSYILRATLRLVHSYKSGEYLKGREETSQVGYLTMSDSDLPGRFDYYCRNSISSVSCVMSVFNADEAASFCNEDVDCKAVVLTSHTTWTGRTIAVFKNGTSTPTQNRGFTLLVKEEFV